MIQRERGEAEQTRVARGSRRSSAPHSPTIPSLRPKPLRRLQLGGNGKSGARDRASVNACGEAYRLSETARAGLCVLTHLDRHLTESILRCLCSATAATDHQHGRLTWRQIRPRRRERLFTNNRKCFRQERAQIDDATGADTVSLRGWDVQCATVREMQRLAWWGLVAGWQGTLKAWEPRGSRGP